MRSEPLSPLVRELGFTGSAFAGTDLSPSAVHALIEIEKGGMTARDLGALLHLEKSSVSGCFETHSFRRHHRRERQDVGRVKCFRDTAGRTGSPASMISRAGRSWRRWKSSPPMRADGDGRPAPLRTALTGKPAVPQIDIAAGYRPGIIARITEMHALYYARTRVSASRSKPWLPPASRIFLGAFGNTENDIWVASDGRRIVGSIAIDGEDMGGRHRPSAMVHRR